VDIGFSRPVRGSGTESVGAALDPVDVLPGSLNAVDQSFLAFAAGPVI
jgi:hypothetical protein